MKPKSDITYVLIVLTYRNTKDLIDFFKHYNIPDSKVVVVNSYFDDETDSLIKDIAITNNADFISVPNNGYGAGNNRGIEYALANFNFKFLIISNADVTINDFPQDLILKNNDCIIAPKIKTLKGKNQNPSSPFKPLAHIEHITYILYKHNCRKLIWGVYAYSRINKIAYYLISKFRKKIFSPHGAFFIIPVQILKRMVPLFNEEMFLFYEENHIGMKADKLGIKTVYLPDIIIDHKEDGSVSLLKENTFKFMKDSYLKYYEFWNQK